MHFDIKKIKFLVKNLMRPEPKGFKVMRELDKHLLKLKVEVQDPFV